jgi:hypothetical protein
MKESCDTAPASAAATTGGDAPEWVIEELPPQCAEVARQIAELRQKAATFDRVAAVLWQTGPELLAALSDLFTALGCTVDPAGGTMPYDLKVTLDDSRAMLVQVVSGRERLDRRAPVLARVLQALQDATGERDRVVLATNLFPEMPLEKRPDEQVTQDAMRLIQGLGANVVPTRTLFGIWKSSLDDMEQARKRVANLHAMDGGIFR